MDDTGTQPSLATDLTGAKRVGSDEFFYDIFGVNIKGLKSIWTLIRQPAEYFEAARLPDWGGDHWPSIRIWIGLMGIMAALQFVWASENSETTVMFQNLAIMLGEVIRQAAEADGVVISLEALDKEALGKRAFKLWALIYPFFFIGAMCVFAFIFRVWKPAVGFVVRLRYLFAIVIPGSVYGLISTLAMVNVTGPLYQTLAFIQVGVLLLLYWITAYRGPFAKFDTSERIAMSAITAFMLLIFIFVANFIAMIISIIPVGADVFETLGPQLEAVRAARE